MAKLQWLDLAETDVGDAGLAHLQVLNEVRVLDLERTKVSDAGLDRLPGKRSGALCWLDVSGTKVTDDGVTNLKKSKIKIVR